MYTWICRHCSGEKEPCTFTSPVNFKCMAPGNCPVAMNRCEWKRVGQAFYTVRHLHKSEWNKDSNKPKFSGPSHGCDQDAKTTACGKPITKNWFFTSNDHKGEITCRKCLRVLESLEEHSTLPTTGT